MQKYKHRPWITGLQRVASAVVNELFLDPGKWSYVLCKIATGTKEWLRVAVEPNKGADAGAGETLIFAVGEALEKAPENVFNIVLNSFSVEEICGGPDVDDARYNSYDLAMKAIDRRIKRVLSVSDPKLKETCQRTILKWCKNFYNRQNLFYLNFNKNFTTTY